MQRFAKNFQMIPLHYGGKTIDGTSLDGKKQGECAHP